MFKKQIVLIAGGSGGIGRAVAEKLAIHHQVILLGRSAQKLERMALSLGVDHVCADLTDFKSLQIAVGQVLAKYNQIDVAINSVGMLIDGALDRCLPDEIEKLLKTNVLGAIYFSQAVLPRMKQLSSGKIIHLGSQASLVARKYRSVYNASKWALRGFALSLQEEVAKHNIAVSLVHPGLVKTDLLKKAGVDLEEAHSLDPRLIASWIKFLVESEPGLVVPEIGLRSLKDY